MNLRKTHKVNEKFVLHDRDRQIVEMFSNGMTSRSIANEGNISHKTVEAVAGKLMRQYNCFSMTHLVATFIRKKIIK